MKNNSFIPKQYRIALNLKITALACFLLIVTSMGCASAPAKEKGNEAEFHYKMGLSYLNESNIQMAFVEFQKSIQLRPNDKNTLNKLGLIHIYLEEYDKAQDYFMRAISMDEGFSEAKHNLATVYLNQHKYKEAEQTLKSALSNPIYATPENSFHLLGVIYYRTGDYHAAVNAFKASLKRSPNFPLPLYGMALSYNKMGRYGEAAASITRAIEIDPSFKGNRDLFTDHIKRKLITAKNEDEAEFRDYLEILKY